MKNSEKKVRVTIDLTAQFNRRLEQLEALADASSKADIIRQALQLFEYVARRTTEGYTFRAVSRDGRVENLVFFGAGPAPTAVEKESLVNA
jgi:predicted transcriptional regulator